MTSKIEDSYKDSLVRVGDNLLINNINWHVKDIRDGQVILSTTDLNTGKVVDSAVSIIDIQKHKEQVIRFASYYKKQLTIH